MPIAVIDGITTRYDVVGSGPPVLMFAPGGFDATIEKWTTQGIYARIRPVEHLSKKYSCIVFDRRESGESGGRVEPISWAHYAAQAKGLLNHLGIARAHILGACMGCPPALALAVAQPEIAASLVLYWPVGGAHYRINSHARLSEHLGYVQEHGLDGVVALVQAEGKTFNQDPRGGLWASVIRREPNFAQAYARLDVKQYTALIDQIRRNLFDRDTAPGAEPEDLLRLDIPALVVPGRDKSHATSAARFLEECLPRAEYWDVAVADQTEASVPPRLLEFLDRQAANV
ncbi:MAG: alpha/beta hydrolase [Acidobacteria bacterium]|nr:alpha/beta hydrolase [Acidobacteriota bacterium]